MRLSKSTILMYLNCPLQYKLVKVNNVPFESVAMEKGRYFHDIVFKFFDRLGDDIHPEKFEGILKRLLGERWEEFEYLALNFIKLETERFNKEPRNHYLPKYKELNLGGEKIGLSGIIDRVDYEPKNGKYVVYDYKTGMVTNIKKHLFELTIYGYLFTTHFKKPLPNVGIICLKNCRIFRAEITEAHVDSMLKIVNEVRKRIVNEEFYRNTTAICFWCPKNVKEICKKLKVKEI